MNKLLMGFFVAQAVCFCGIDDLRAMETASVDSVASTFDFASLSLGEKNKKLIDVVEKSVGKSGVAEAAALLRGGADVNACKFETEGHVTIFSMPALYIAIKNHNEPMVALLLKQKNLDKKARDYRIFSDSGTALGYAVRCADKCKEDPAAMKSLENIMKQLLDAGFNPNETDDAMKTPLHLAAQYNLVNLADLLLRSGAIVDAQDCNGDTPLHACVKNCVHPEAMMGVLFEHGADQNIANKSGITPGYIVEHKFQDTMAEFIGLFNGIWHCNK